MLVLSFLLGLTPALQAAYVVEPPAGSVGPDFSGQYKNLMAQGVSIPADELRNYKLIIVPGLFSDPIARIFGYFQDEVRALKAAGLQEGADFEILGKADGFNGEAGVQTNSEAIAKAIRASDRPVLLVTHSKGTVDALKALIDEPALRSWVRGWFSIQGAVWGSPVADVVAQSWDDTVVNQVLRLFGGNSKALTDLRRPTRYKYMLSHQDDVAAVMREVPTISFASWKDYADMSWTLREIDLFYYPGYKKDISDGLVEIDDALIPGTPYIVASGVDHGDTTLSLDNGFDRRAFMSAIAAFLLM